MEKKLISNLSKLRNLKDLKDLREKERSPTTINLISVEAFNKSVFKIQTKWSYQVSSETLILYLLII
jgi:hypothetical protein